jgi:hypothetical protein
VRRNDALAAFRMFAVLDLILLFFASQGNETAA